MRLRHVALARRPAAIAEVEEIDRVALPGHPLRSQEAGVPAKVIVNRAAGVIRSKRQPGPPVRASRIDARSGRLAHGSCTSIEEHAVSFAAARTVQSSPFGAKPGLLSTNWCVSGAKGST